MAQPAIIEGNLINDDRPLAVEQQGVQNQGVFAAAGDVSTPAVNTAAVVTYAAAAGVRQVITGVSWSYYGAVPVGGSIVITDAGAVVFSMAIADEGCGFVTFPNPKATVLVNSAMVITLAAAGAACTGRLSILNHWAE